MEIQDDICALNFQVSTFPAFYLGGLPSGKHTKNDGKSPLLMGKLTINGHFQ